MCRHETKVCSRCAGPFECKVGTITQCQCAEVILSIEERSYLEELYTDCLCKGCLQKIKEEYKVFLEGFVFSFKGRR